MGDVAEVAEAVKRIQSHKGILGVMVVNSDGIAIRSTMEDEVTVHYAALVSSFTTKTRAVVKHLDTENELRFIRIRSKKHEILIAPDFETKNDYSLVVLQHPDVGSST